jgi:hypothetical protein
MTLPYIDEHSRDVAAPPDAVWSAIGREMGRQSGFVVRAAATLLGTEARSRQGTALAPGSTIPGFRVSAAEPGERVVYAGRHRFSQYELVFELTPVDDRTRLTAVTLARFPGLRGRVYRALVIGSRGHRLAVHRMLHGMAYVAEAGTR